MKTRSKTKPTPLRSRCGAAVVRVGVTDEMCHGDVRPLPGTGVAVWSPVWLSTVCQASAPDDPTVLIDDDGDVVVYAQHRVQCRVQTLVVVHDGGRTLPMAIGAGVVELVQWQRADLLQPEQAHGGSGSDERRHEVVTRLGEDARRGVVLRDAAVLAEDRDPVPELDRLLDVVGDEHDGLADLRLQLQELVLQPVADDRVDRPERFVHQHDRRVGRERAGDTDPLLLASGQLLGVARAVGLRFQADEVQQLVDACPDPLLVPAQSARDERDVGRDGQVGEEADLLDDIADVAAQLVGVDVGDVPAVEDDPAGRGLDQPVDHPHRRRLAASRRTHQHDDLALGDLQRELLDRR